MKSKILFYFILVTLITTLALVVHAQTFSVVHSFTGGAGGSDPEAGVTIRGNALYGTTGGSDCGTVYQLTHSGSNWSFSTLAALPHNCYLIARVVFGPDGHLYGTSEVGGTYGYGSVFKLTPQVGPCRDAACYWTVNDLHDFGSGTDGTKPYRGDLIWDQQGNIYGTTLDGGAAGYGTVYELTPSGNGYSESVLHNFPGPDGVFLGSGVIFDKKGNLFGAAYQGGTNDGGIIFELTYVPGAGWTEQTLYKFQIASDGANPLGGLIFDAAGNLYGTTSQGGSGGGGTVFELSPSGETWTYKVLHSLTVGQQYYGSWATLSMDGAGNLYGTTVTGGVYGRGNVFKLSNTANGWVYTSLHDFTGDTDGWSPYSNVTIDIDGTLYGTTAGGGDKGRGTVWMIKP